MATVTEAGLCRKYLDRKVLKDHKVMVIVKFFCPPEIRDKILDSTTDS